MNYIELEDREQHERHSMAHVVARAIAEEREQCAKLAESFTPGPTGGAQIAAAIRNRRD